MSRSTGIYLARKYFALITYKNEDGAEDFNREFPNWGQQRFVTLYLAIQSFLLKLQLANEAPETIYFLVTACKVAFCLGQEIGDTGRGRGYVVA
jgi:hypothetical protein